MGNKGLSEETIIKHESFGMVGINRSQSSGTYLFGSIMNHHSFITLTIKHASVRRMLSGDWYSAESLPIVEIEMSHTQFAELITSPGIGDGVPCTIRGLDGKLLEECPPPQEMTSKFAEDLKKTTASTVAQLKDLTQQLGEALLPGNKALSKTELKTLLQGMKSAIQSMTDSIPYIEQSFGETMEEEKNKAKGEMEAVATHLILKTGLNALAQANQKALMPEFIAPQLGSGEKCDRCDSMLVDSKCPHEGQHIL